MASPPQPLHSHIGSPEGGEDNNNKSILQKIKRLTTNKKQSSLKSLDGEGSLSRSPSPESRQSSRTSLVAKDSMVLLPHMSHTNSFAHSSQSSLDGRLSGPITKQTTTPRRATMDSPRVSTPIHHIMISEDREPSTSSVMSTPRRRSMPEVSPLLIISEAPIQQHPPAIPAYAFGSPPPSAQSRRRSTPNPIKQQEIEHAGDGMENGGSLLSAPKRSITRSKSLLDALRGIFKSNDKDDATKSPPKSPTSSPPLSKKGSPAMVKPPSSPHISSVTSSPNSGSPPIPHSPTHSTLPVLPASVLYRRTPPQLLLPPLTPQSRTGSNPTSLSSLARSRSNPLMGEELGEGMGSARMATPTVLDAETIRNRRKSDTYVPLFGNTGSSTEKSNLAPVGENSNSSLRMQPVNSTLLAPPNRANFGAALSWREVANDGTKVWKNQSMAKTSTNIVAVERMSSVVKGEPSQEPGEQIERPLSLEFFELLQQIGRGGYGQVYLSRKTDTGEIVALKVMDKTHISRKNKVLNIRNERNALAHLSDQSWIVQLLYAFQDEEKVYLAMEYLPGGDMRGILRNIGSMEEDDLRTWGAEMILAVNEVHQLGYIHRDLKPENFLVDKNGHLKIADLGISTSGASAFVDLKIKVKAIHRGSVISSELVLNDGKTKLKRDQSVVGSPAYMAPEMLERSGYGPEVDSWSLGCMFYEMLTSKNPFEGMTPQAAFANVLRWREVLQELQLTAESLMSKCAWDLIKKFLCEPKDRLLRNGLAGVMAHPFFDGVDWSRLRTRVPPFIPKLSDEVDTSYFPSTREDAFGEMQAVDTEDFDDPLETSMSIASVPHLPLPSSPQSPRESPFPTASIHRVYSNGNYQQETSRAHDSSRFHEPSRVHDSSRLGTPLSHIHTHRTQHYAKPEENEHVNSFLEESDDPPRSLIRAHVASPPPPDDDDFGDLSHPHFFLPSTPSSAFNMKNQQPIESVNSIYTLHNYNALAHPSLSTADSSYTVNTYNSVQSVPSMGSVMYSMPSSMSVASEQTLTASPSIPSGASALTPVASFTLTPPDSFYSPDVPAPSHNLNASSPHNLSPSASPRRTSPLRSASSSPRRSSPLRSGSPSPRRASPPRGTSPLRSPHRSNSPSPRDSLSPSPRQPAVSPKASAAPPPPTFYTPPPIPAIPITMPTIPTISNIPTSTDSARSLFTPTSSNSNPPSPSLSSMRSPHARPRATHANNEINLHQLYSNARTASSSSDPTTTSTSSIITPPPIRKQKNSSLSSLDPPSRSIGPSTNSLSNVYSPAHALSSSLTSSLLSQRVSTPPLPSHDHSPHSTTSTSTNPSYSLGALLTHKAHGTPTSIAANQGRKIQISGFDFVRSGGQ